jgi:hypothetical protein
MLLDIYLTDLYVYYHKKKNTNGLFYHLIMVHEPLLNEVY